MPGPAPPRVRYPGQLQDSDLALAGEFSHARRVLNLLTGRYLYPRREGWFRSAV